MLSKGLILKRNALIVPECLQQKLLLSVSFTSAQLAALLSALVQCPNLNEGATAYSLASGGGANHLAISRAPAGLVFQANAFSSLHKLNCFSFCQDTVHLHRKR